MTTSTFPYSRLFWSIFTPCKKKLQKVIFFLTIILKLEDRESENLCGIHLCSYSNDVTEIFPQINAYCGSTARRADQEEARRVQLVWHVQPFQLRRNFDTS